MSGKNRQADQEKKEKKNRDDGSSGIDIPVGRSPEPGAAPEKEPGGSEGKKDPAADLEEKTRQAAEYFDKWLRLQAEFENFKKRTQKEKSDQIKFGNESLLKALLPVLDNLERALDHGKSLPEAKSLLEGVEITLKQFLNVLERFGAKPVPAMGEVFNPEIHEAVSQMESDFESDRVVSEVQRGYAFHERLLRPAKVIVSRSRRPSAGEEKKAGD